MTTDLWMLFATAPLAWVLILVAAGPGLMKNGLGWAMGNRDSAPPPAPWEARAKRASANMQENIALFAILVLVAHVSGRHGDLSALGAIVFFAARVAHAVVYIAGIPGVRTIAWAVSIVGMGMIAADILG